MAIVRIAQPIMGTDMDVGTLATIIHMGASLVAMIAAAAGNNRIDLLD